MQEVFLLIFSNQDVAAAKNRKIGHKSSRKPKGFTGCRNGESPGRKGRHNVLFVHNQTAGNDWLADFLRQTCCNPGHGSRQDIHRIRMGRLLADIFKGKGIQKKETLDGDKSQILCMAD